MGIRKTVQLILLDNILHETIPICFDHSNSSEIDVTLQPQLSMEGTTARLHPSGSNCCAFSTSISHTSTFVEGGPRPYIWMLQEIGRLVIPTSFQWGLPQSSNLANLSALMIMMGLLPGEVWSRHRGVSSLGWRICEVKNVTKRYNDPGSSSQVYLAPTVHSSLQNCPPKHGVPLLLALGQWNLHCSWAVLNWRCSMFPSPSKIALSKPYETVWAPHDGLFVLLRTGVTGWSKLTRPTILSLNIQDFTYLFSKFESCESAGFTGTPESTIAFLAWILGYAIT